jgi:MFS transporter, DHA1 family, multidrug resistance protein
MSSWKRTFYAAFAAQVCSILGFSLAMPFMAFYIRQLGITNDAAVYRWSGYVNGAAGLTMAIFAPIWGHVADRVGRRPMVMRSMYGGVLVLLLMSIAQNVWHLLIFRLLQGMLTGTIAALVALVAAEAPRERAGYVLGVMQSAVFVGFALGPLVGGELAEALGYRATFALSSLLLLAGGLLVQFGTREVFVPRPAAESAGSGGFRAVFAAPGFMAAVFALFTLRYANSITAPTFGLFIEEIYGKAAGLNRVVGRVTGVGGLAAAVGSFFLGALSDRWRAHKRMLIASCVFGGIVSLAYAFATTVGHLVGLRILFGLGAAGILPAANAIIRHATADEHMGKAYGVTASAGSIGWMLGPWSGGEAAAVYGLRAPFILMAVAIVFSAGLVALLVRPDARRAPCAAVDPPAGA